MPNFDQDDVAPFLPDHLPTKRFKGLDGFPSAQLGKRRHQAYTSTWRVSMVRGRPCSARTSRQSWIASLMFSNASSLVEPWLTQPGTDGHSAIQTPSSSRSRLTINFILTSWSQLKL